MGARLLADLARLGVSASIGSEQDNATRAIGGGQYSQTSWLVTDERIYSCIVQLEDRSIDHLKVYSHYHGHTPLEYEISWSVHTGEPGDIGRIKALGRHLKAAYRGEVHRHHVWKGGRLANRLRDDPELSQMPAESVRDLVVGPRHNTD